MRHKGAIPTAAVLMLAAACGGGAGGGPSAAAVASDAPSAGGPPSDRALPTPGASFTAFVGEVTVTYEGVTYRFSTTQPEVENMTERVGCHPDLIGQLIANAPGVDEDGEPTDPPSYVQISLNIGEPVDVVYTDSMMMEIESGLYQFDRDDPGTWEIETHSVSGRRASGQVNLIDALFKEPRGSATFELTCA